MDTPHDLITVKEARTLLGVSSWKMAELLKGDALRHFTDPLDRRKKLVSKSEVLRLKMPRAEAA